MSDNRDVGKRSSADWKKSAHHGAGEWVIDKIHAIVLIPLTLWAAWAAVQIAGGGYDAAVAFAKVPLNAGLIGLTVLISAWHMYNGVRVIIDDYLAGPMRGFTTFLTLILSLAVVIATGAALWLLHQAA